MTTPKTFQGARMKLQRAQVHIDQGREALIAVAQQYERDGTPRVAFTQYYWPRGHCILILASELAPFSRQAALIFGDALQNLNSAMEHIAWELVERGKRPPETLTEAQKADVHFPLVMKPPSRKRTWRDICEKALPGVGPRQRAVIRFYQPFRGGKRAELHRLRVIRDLANTDKHRIIQPLYHRAFEVGLSIGGYHNFQERQIVTPAGPFDVEVGTELGRIYGRRTGSNPYADLSVTGNVEPSFERGWWAGDSLQMGRRLILRIIRRLEQTL